MVNRVVFLSIIAALGVISASLCAPALPFIADHFSAQFSYIQFTISLFLVGNALGQFLSGPLFDQVVQRAVLLSALFLYVIASCGCAMADHVTILFICRFFQGMGSAAGPVLARAIASSNSPTTKSAQMQSYGAMGVGIASILAILTSGKLTLISWRSNFWLAACLGIILLLWARFTLKAPDKRNETLSLKKIFHPMKEVFSHPQFLGSAICHSMTYGLMYGYITLFPFLLIELFHEKNPTQVGIYSAYMIACYMMGAFLASRLVLWRKANQIIVLGVIIQTISGACLILSNSTASLFSALFLFNFSIGIILPLTSASAMAPFAGKGVGTASSSLGLTYRLVGSTLSILICQFSLIRGGNLGLAILLISLLSLTLLRWTLFPKKEIPFLRR